MKLADCFAEVPTRGNGLADSYHGKTTGTMPFFDRMCGFPTQGARGHPLHETGLPLCSIFHPESQHARQKPGAHTEAGQAARHASWLGADVPGGRACVAAFRDANRPAAMMMKRFFCALEQGTCPMMLILHHNCPLSAGRREDSKRFSTQISSSRQWWTNSRPRRSRTRATQAELRQAPRATQNSVPCCR